MNFKCISNSSIISFEKEMQKFLEQDITLYVVNSVVHTENHYSDTGSGLRSARPVYTAFICYE